MDYPALEKWVNINSQSQNSEGLKEMADALQSRLETMNGRLDRISLPPITLLDGTLFQAGEVIRFTFNEKAPVQILFSGHMDTVHAPDNPFRTLRVLPNGKYSGPGVTDMKGGLYIMIEAVDRFMSEESNGSARVGGEILINADEEMGFSASPNPANSRIST